MRSDGKNRRGRGAPPPHLPSCLLLLPFLVLLTPLRSISAFYLPGVQPTEFKKGDSVPLMMNSLTSVETHLPMKYNDIKVRVNSTHSCASLSLTHLFSLFRPHSHSRILRAISCVGLRSSISLVVMIGV